MRTKDLLEHLIPTTRRLVGSHLRSFNYFLDHGISAIANARVNNQICSDMLEDFRIVYKSIRVARPEISENFVTRPLYPQECRLREMTYSGNIMIDVEIHGLRDVRDSSSIGTHMLRNLCIGKMPIMLGSNYCWLSDKASVGIKVPVLDSGRCSLRGMW